MSVSELLTKAGTSWKAIQKHGAVVSITYRWICDASKIICDPYEVGIERVDGGRGHFDRKARHYTTSDGTQKRDASIRYGLRLLPFSTGRGREFRWALLFIQLGCLAALLGAARYICDFFLLNIGSSLKRGMYFKCKVVETSPGESAGVSSASAPLIEGSRSTNKFMRGAASSYKIG